jgi:hypothetical protein
MHISFIDCMTNAWFQLDGEQKQIECYTEEDTLKIL